MLREMHLIYKSLTQLTKPVLALAVLALTACSHSPTNTIKGPHVAFVKTSYDKAWRATQLALNKYPIQTSNVDKGYIATQAITLNSVWTPAHKSIKTYGGERYRLKVNLIKGNVKSNYKGETYKEPGVKIIVKKEVSRLRDFIAEPERMQSDGIEEELIIYRIKREILIEKVIERRSNKG